MGLIGKIRRLILVRSGVGGIIIVLISSLLPLGLLAATNCTGGVPVEGQNPTNQILIQPSMILSESDDGIAFQAGSLVDEQFCLPDSKWEPTSETWSPANETESRIYIDLGQNYQLSQIAFHVLEKTDDLELSIGTPGNWEYLATINSLNAEGWEYFNLDAQTRFLRIEATNLETAFVNELQVFGLSADRLSEEKSGVIPGFGEKLPEDFGNNDIVVNEDIVSNQLRISIPEDLSHNFTLELYNLNGVKLMQKEFIYNISTRVLVDITNSCDRCGVYILHYYNNAGIEKTLKFMKKR